ncbi:hypothetical protein HCB97_00595, partial [Streptococcus suis]|nr:hypothetical protein [Streptococcus suis]
MAQLIASNQLTLTNINDGQTAVVHFAYSDNANGVPLSHTDTGQRYQGYYSDNAQAHSGDANRYTWNDRWAKIEVGARNYFKGYKHNEEIALPIYENVGSFMQIYNKLTYPLSEADGKTFTISFEAISPNGDTIL